MKTFRELRFDPNHHLGMGDVRLTIDMQDEIEQEVEQLRKDKEQLLRLGVLAFKVAANVGSDKEILVSKVRILDSFLVNAIDNELWEEINDRVKIG